MKMPFKENRYWMENYNDQKPFSSFLPGVAGKNGIPLWAFYVNRGQGISSFGLRDKNGAILEFFPANAAYTYVDRIGFRTFIKTQKGLHEPFAQRSDSSKSMGISKADMTIVDSSKTHDITTSVTYFGLVEEDLAGLVRKVTFQNTSQTKQTIEVADGLAQLLPSGVDHGGYKAVSNLLRSWMEVKNLEHNAAFYTLRASTSDEAQVEKVVDGNYYVSFIQGKPIVPLVDINLLFGDDTSLSYPINFAKSGVDAIGQSPQVTANKVPCGFTLVTLELEPGASVTLHTLIGHAGSVDILNTFVSKIKDASYFDQKEAANHALIDALTHPVKTKTAYPLFDAYMEQNLLDNLLRGGQPWVIDEELGKVYHLFSRKHGDPERDYNFFVLAPEYYSQGNGNFRDVCQNRRNDVVLNQEVKDFNLWMFGQLIQADGYNPLGISGVKFQLAEDKIEALVQAHYQNNQTIKTLLKKPFTPGAVITILKQQGFDISQSESLVLPLLKAADMRIDAQFGEGYWQDHFTYILDLVENFEAIYPDQMTQALYDKVEYLTYDSPTRILPKKEKYVLTHEGTVRQYHATIPYEKHKMESLKMTNGSNWLKNKQNQEVKTNLFAKLFLLSVNKYSSLDPEGMGLEYEAEKPGWNDAMNGLPGLFGSGMGETVELLRLVKYLKKHLMTQKELQLPKEFTTFVHQMLELESLDGMAYWNAVGEVKETYREAIYLGTEGMIILDKEALVSILDAMEVRLNKGMEKATALGNGILPTYFFYEAVSYDKIKDKESDYINAKGFPCVKVKAFKVHVMPHFLEAPARQLKLSTDKVALKRSHVAVKATELYDKKMRFYQTSVSLDACSLEIGRARAFTKGWLERESNFLHMTYKYILGLIKAGLYADFYEDLMTNFVCFMDPAIYGRSPLENSSFIAPSNNPNPHIHGTGFVARLSGSTAEALSIYQMMFLGKQPFGLIDDKLVFQPKPILRHDFFKQQEVVTFLFNKTQLIYRIDGTYNTYDPQVVIDRFECVKDGKIELIQGSKVVEPWATKIRQGYFDQITIYFREENK